MNPATAIPTSVLEINRLHAEAKRLAGVSDDALHAALVAAWDAGHLLAEEKRRVLARNGRGEWILWLRCNFRGTVRTAQRYMKLSQGVEDITFLRGLSLRQAYSRLGIATEPKSGRRRPLRNRLPAYVVLSNRLFRALKGSQDKWDEKQAESYRNDLRALYERLRPLFHR